MPAFVLERASEWLEPSLLQRTTNDSEQWATWRRFFSRRLSHKPLTSSLDPF